MKSKDTSYFFFAETRAGAEGEAGGAAGRGKEVAAVNLQERRRRVRHFSQVSRPQECGGLRGLHQGEDQTHP